MKSWCNLSWKGRRILASLLISLGLWETLTLPVKGVSTPAIDETVDCEVLIVGGGLAGAATA
ncbi:MAG: hypothetical protein ACLFV6_18795, partial [Spirulinaceae cyanobacterium]